MIQEVQVLGKPLADASDEEVTESVALEILSRKLSSETPPLGYLGGRTQMRNVIADETGCSLLRAEQVVEALVAAGDLRYHEDDYARGHLPASWVIPVGQTRRGA